MTFSIPASLARYYPSLSAADYAFLQSATTELRKENPDYSWGKVCRLAYYQLLDSHGVSYVSED